MRDPETDPEENLEITDHVDDAVIGRAFRWSAFGLVGIVVVVGVGFFLATRPAEKEAEKVTVLVAPVNPEQSAATVPSVSFSEITSEAGIRFVHNNGAASEKLLPETMGGGVAFFDFDGDDDQDLLFTNGTSWPGASEAKETSAALYENDGKGHFEDVTEGSGLDVPLFGMGVAIGDYDGDGQPDVFLTAVGENRLFKNLGEGRFEDVTAGAGVGGLVSDWSTCASWFDCDNDGDLDLFVGNYVKWSKEIDFQLGSTLVGLGRAYGQPMNFEGSYPILFQNEGDGSFTDVSEESGVRVSNKASGVPVAKSLGIAPIDLNRDGWMDFIVANDTVRNFVFSNRWDRTFKEMGSLTGIAYDTYGKARGAMGIDTARFRVDGALAVGIGNFANEMTALYVEQSRPMIFTDEAIPAGIGPASRLLLKFGLFFFDYDLDGWQDLLTANGHLEEEISQIQKSQHYEQPAQLFWNSGPEYGCQFLEVSAEHSGEALFRPIVGRGSAFADIDNDGDLDFVVTQINGSPRLFRNDQALGHHWIRIRLRGNTQNRDGVGAWIKVTVGGRVLWRQVMPTRSYLSQSELPVTVGIGDASGVDALEIVWPGGKVQSVENVVIDQVTTVTEE
ncbi:CRTAC1 family protein [Verrucomicrobia bacterium]|nr:CRTAC1 family protein [Verrucomicrobiota bacterium]